MITARKAPRGPTGLPQHEHFVLVFQGGGALGAYQAGVYEAFAEAGLLPDWLAGVSIGAINAALIAGNLPENRVARLREFWQRVSSGVPLAWPGLLDPFRVAFNRFSSTTAATFGVPGMFEPRVPGPWFAPAGSPEALSFYDSEPLRSTLLELVDFKLINSHATRLSVGAVDVRSGNSIYFDNKQATQKFGAEHVMASAALPPGLPPIVIKGEAYWDGGLVSNTPLWYVLDDGPMNALIAQVDLFSAQGAFPGTIDQVLERAKDIQYSSRTRFNTNRGKELENLRETLHRVLEKLPKRIAADPDVKQLDTFARGRRLSVVHLINRRFKYSSQSKDYDFSRASIDGLWDAGREAVRRTLADPRWRDACHAEAGMHAFDLQV